MRTCPLCSCHEADVIARQRYCLEETSVLPTETDIVACTRCGFVYARSDKTAADYNGYYSRQTKYESSVNASGSGDYELDQRRIAALVDSLTEALPASSHILDIGAAKGGVLVEICRRGYHNLYGVDASDACVRAIRSHGIEACHGRLEDAVWDLDPRRFDLIILSHVLEHVYDVAAGLASARRRLAAGGSIYVEMPDANRYTVDGFPPYYFFDPEHINHFDLASLRQMAINEGMSVSRWISKDLDVGAGTPYPAVGAWLTEAAGNVHSLTISGAERIRSYIKDSASALMQQPEMAKLVSLVQGGYPIILWGAGSHAKRLLANTPLAEANLLAIMDSDETKHGKSLRGVEICAVGKGLELAKREHAAVVVAIAVNAEPVVSRLQRELEGISVISV